MWVNKNWSLKQLHFQVYLFMRKMFYIWYETYEAKSSKYNDYPMPPFKKQSIDEKDDTPLDFKQF